MSEALTIAEELTRKALDHLESSYLALERGEITMLEFSTIVDTLFAICSGIVDREFFGIISKASKEITKDRSFVNYAMLRKGDDVCIVNFTKNEPNVNVLYASGTMKEMTAKCEGHESAEKFNKTIESLISKGFEEVNI